MNSKPKCGLCGKTTKLIKTECCGNWICDSVRKYGCYERHDRFTLCGAHHANQHSGLWQSCKECIKIFPAEMAAWYGTNKFNFEKMKNPPAFQPTKCSSCGAVIKLSDGGYSKRGDEHWCFNCR